MSSTGRTHVCPSDRLTRSKAIAEPDPAVIHVAHTLPLPQARAASESEIRWRNGWDALLVPAVRIERTTFRLQGGCSTS
jgi:hypothetical protein